MKQLFNTFILLFIFSFGIHGQDKIFKNNKEVIICKVHVIGIKTIEYTQPEFNSGVTFTIEKRLVSRIEFESGSIMDFQEKPIEIEDYQTQNRNIFKVDFFSLMTGNLTIGYERSLELQRSFEGSIGIIGVGTNMIEPEMRGLFIRAGYKFKRSPEVYFNASQYSHILKGSFIRPDLVFSYFYSENDVGVSGINPGDFSLKSVRSYNYSYAFFINLGKQWVAYDKVAISYYLGLGYAFSSSDGYFFSHVTGGNQYPIAAQAGLTIGFLY